MEFTLKLSIPSVDGKESEITITGGKDTIFIEISNQSWLNQSSPISVRFEELTICCPNPHPYVRIIRRAREEPTITIRLSNFPETPDQWFDLINTMLRYILAEHPWNDLKRVMDMLLTTISDILLKNNPACINIPLDGKSCLLVIGPPGSSSNGGR